MLQLTGGEAKTTAEKSGEIIRIIEPAMERDFADIEIWIRQQYPGFVEAQCDQIRLGRHPESIMKAFAEMPGSHLELPCQFINFQRGIGVILFQVFFYVQISLWFRSHLFAGQWRIRQNRSDDLS